MTQPEETTAALIARLHEENRIACLELARLTHIGAQEAAERERLKRERDEQRARADKAERWLKHTSEREMKLDADLAKASERVQGLANELDQERLKSQALLKFKNIWLDRCTKARKERDEFRASHAALDRLLAERTRERDEARAESLQAGLVGREMAENLDAVTAECVKAQDLAQRHSQDCERALRERDEAREHLTKLEWAGLCKDDRGGPLTACCPICQGVKPGHEVGSRFAPEQVGHRPDCWFAKKDKQITIPAGTLKAGDVVTLRVSFRADGAPGYAIGMKPETVDTTKDAAVSVTATKSEPARPEPRFKVGEKVVHTVYGEKSVLLWCGWDDVRGDHLYLLQDEVGAWESKPKPAPKFAVGEWVILGAGEAGEIRSREWTMNRWHYRVNELLCAEHCIAAQTPQHKHDCKGGVFLGRMGNKDLYYSTVGSGFVGGPWLVVIGNRLYHECNIDRPTGPEHDEARRRAVARGLVK